MRVIVLMCAIFIVGCAQQPKQPPKDIKLSTYYVKNEKKLKITQFPKPSIPAEAIEKMQQGWCATKFDISKEGVPENIKILECSPKDLFEDFCRRSIEGFRFDTEGQQIFGYTQNCVYHIK